MELVLEHRVKSTKLTLTWAYLALPCHMAHNTFNIWTWRVIHFIHELVQKSVFRNSVLNFSPKSLH